jgi:dihydroxyacetone kinase-like protein
VGTPIFDLPDGQIELGVGIHGEPGRRREQTRTAREIVEVSLDAILSDLEPAAGARVLPFVNGLGGTPMIELYLLYGEVDRQLRAAGLEPVRNLVGSYITSLEMAGASITVLELDDELVSLWDAPVNTPALRWGV